VAVKDPQAFKMAFDRLVDNPGFRDSQLKSQHDFLDKSFANKGTAASVVVDYLEGQTLLRAKTQSCAVHE